MNTPNLMDDTIGARVRRLRLAAEETQSALARHIGMGRPHITRIELNRDRPGRITLAALAAHYRVSMDYLETGVGDSEPADKTFHPSDKEAWLLLGEELGSRNRNAVLDFVERTILRRRSR